MKIEILREIQDPRMALVIYFEEIVCYYQRWRGEIARVTSRNHHISSPKITKKHTATYTTTNSFFAEHDLTCLYRRSHGCLGPFALSSCSHDLQRFSVCSR
jgi:hypothetical protein